MFKTLVNRVLNVIMEVFYINKRGFTLIEIIISLTLIIGIGFISTVKLIKDNSDDLEELNKKIIDAAKVYINIEKDNNGNTYHYGILNGGKGVKIPVSNLVKKGYINENLSNKLYSSLEKLDDNKDYYILFVEDSNYCDEGQIKTLLSWMDKPSPVYLCSEFNGGESKQTLIDTILYDYNNQEIPVSDNPEDNYKFFGATWLGGDVRYSYATNSGLFKKSDNTHYYTGVVGNNYVTFEKLDNVFWRIISFKDNKIKLITENTILNEWRSKEDISLEYGNSEHSYLYNRLIEPIDKYLFLWHYLDTAPGIDLDYDLLTEEEFDYAGYSISSLHDDDSYKFSFLSDSWITSGGPFIIKKRDGSLQIVNYKTLPLNCGNGCNGIAYYDSNVSCNDLTNNDLSNDYSDSFQGFLQTKKCVNVKIRPVITIENRKVISGKGTVVNPYILEGDLT